MQRRRFVCGSIAIGLALNAGAQTAGTPARIAYLSGYSSEVDRPLIAAFRRGLRELGYVEGRNLTMDVRYTAGVGDKHSAMAQELAALKPDVFVVLGPVAARAASKAAPHLPIVFTNVQDPLGSGLVASLARPGGNMTGMSDGHAASVTKRLGLIKEAIPGVTRVGVMWNETSATNARQLEDLQAAAPHLALALVSLPVRRREDIAPQLQRLKGQHATALLLLGDIVLTSNMRSIAEWSAANRVAGVYTTKSWVDNGGFMAYGANFPELYRRSAAFVDKILKGAKPGDLPIEQASKFDLVINLKTAKALGITIPQAFLQRADEVIQ